MLGKPVLELAMGRFHNAARPEYLAGNHVVRTVDEAEEAVVAYLAGAQVPIEQQRARAAFIEDFYYRVDGQASERCAEIIHAQVSPPMHSDSAHGRVIEAAASARAAWRRAEDSRLPNRLKDALGIPRTTSLRVWKGLRPRRDLNRGLFVAQPEVTPAMVQEVFERLGAVWGPRPVR